MEHHTTEPRPPYPSTGARSTTQPHQPGDEDTTSRPSPDTPAHDVAHRPESTGEGRGERDNERDTDPDSPFSDVDRDDAVDVP
jgi:hypothetical protein